MPKLSIITVNYNNRDGLIDTAKSVVAQTWTDYEWIIIDGGSTDGSAEVIKEYAAKTDKLVYWCSEKDGGIYQGMNKGIDKASGEYCWFLNSGDYAYKNTTLEEIFANVFDEDIVYGDICSKWPPGCEIQMLDRIVKKGNLDVRSPSNWVLNSVIAHQASFIKRKLLNDLGGYKTVYKHVSDTEFFMDAIFNHNASAKHIRAVFAVYLMDGLTGRAESMAINHAEYGMLTVKYFPLEYRKLFMESYIREALRKSMTPFDQIAYFVKRVARFGLGKTLGYYKRRLFGEGA